GFAKERIEVLTGDGFERLERAAPGAQVTVRGDTEPRTLAAERVLVAVGRSPLTEGLRLEDRRVRTERGFIVVDGAMRTSAAGVSAIGDLVGPLLLAHTASEQGVRAVEAMVQPREGGQGLDVTRVPMCVYCQPGVAGGGHAQAEGPGA